MRRYALIAFLFIVMPLFVTSTTILEYNETDYINLRPAASDPDKDSMTYFFNYPLSNKGTWQTTYGDNGIYNTKVTVSDGRLLTAENITLIINKKEEKPMIEILAPPEKSIYIREGESIFFNIKASDLNKDELKISWILDGAEVIDGTYYTYTADYYSQGIHAIDALATDGVYNVSEEWNIEVEDFDRAALLNEIVSITVNETELVKLDIPDFEKYYLQYNISGPLDMEGRWQTTYNDAGLYTVTIGIWDDYNFSAEKRIKILVENVDRPADFLEKDSYWISEDEEIGLFLNYTDPDGDRVSISVGNMPEGATFKNEIITWRPDYDTVTKDTILDDIARRYHTMNRLFTINVNVTSNNLTVEQDIGIRVFNKNRAPVMKDVPPVIIKEGENVIYDISAYDPDNDTLSYSFGGFSNNYKTKYSHAGTYPVKITVSDGFLSDEKYTMVTVLPVNQPPVLKNILPMTINENQRAEILLEAKDPDGDELTYSAGYLPEGAYIKGGRFVWTPGYDTVTGGSSKTVNLTFKASDGYFESEKTAEIIVNNVNRQPVLLTSSQVDSREFRTGEDITLSVEVYDPDGDALTYTWQTSMFDVFRGNNSIAVKYDSAGKKKVKVTASDGKENAAREWEFPVVKKPEVRLVYLKQ